MNNCLITTVSMTLAMRVKSALRANGIDGAVIRLPPAYTENGCAYGVEIARDSVAAARHVLQISDIAYEKLICPDDRAAYSPERRRGR